MPRADTSAAGAWAPTLAQQTTGRTDDMPNDRFTVTEYNRTIIWGDDGDDDYTDETEEGDEWQTDARGIVDLVAGGYWDAIDEGSDGTAILYPADSYTNYRTGADESTSYAIRADRPENLRRVLAIARGRLEARDAKRRAR